MKQYIIKQQVMISEEQDKTLHILKDYGVNVSQFIRQSIKEKLQREWKSIKLAKEKRINNAPEWVYK